MFFLSCYFIKELSLRPGLGLATRFGAKIFIQNINFYKYKIALSTTDPPSYFKVCSGAFSCMRFYYFSEHSFSDVVHDQKKFGFGLILPQHTMPNVVPIKFVVIRGYNL